MAGRRVLSFASLDEVMPDLERLLYGHETVGRWSLGQIVNHLASSISGSVDGYAAQAPWAIRRSIGRLARRSLFASGRMIEGIPLPDAFLPRAVLDAREEAESLKRSLDHFTSAAGPLVDHPFLGPLTREEWTRLHAIHCAHHLSFARPVGPG